MGSRAVADASAMREADAPGHMWMELLTGDHVSTDCAVVGGQARWFRHATGLAAEDGMFAYWIIHPEADDALETSLAAGSASTCTATPA